MFKRKEKFYYVTGIGSIDENKTMYISMEWHNSLKTREDVSLLIEYIKNSYNVNSFFIVNVMKLKGDRMI